jgi:hypothetical protein
MTQDNAPYTDRTNNGTVFVGTDVNIFQAAMLASSLRLYAKTGMKPTRGVGPTQMLKLASAITGYTYKRGEFEQAASDLSNYVENLKRLPRNIEDIK